MISSPYKLDVDFPGLYQLTHSSLNLDARLKKKMESPQINLLESQMRERRVDKIERGIFAI